jgi:hypothetical protein
VGTTGDGARGKRTLFEYRSGDSGGKRADDGEGRYDDGPEHLER